MSPGHGAASCTLGTVDDVHGLGRGAGGGIYQTCAALRPSQTCQACLKDAVDPDLPSERSPSAQVPPYSQRSLNPVRTCLQRLLGSMRGALDDVALLLRR